MLHTVNKSPFLHNNLESCLRFANRGDVLLLLEDGVYAAAAGTSKSHLVESVASKCEIYAIEADIKARGLEKIIEQVRVASYADFVDLVEKHRVHAWL